MRRPPRCVLRCSPLPLPRTALTDSADLTGFVTAYIASRSAIQARGSNRVSFTSATQFCTQIHSAAIVRSNCAHHVRARFSVGEAPHEVIRPFARTSSHADRLLQGPPPRLSPPAGVSMPPGSTSATSTFRPAQRPPPSPCGGGGGKKGGRAGAPALCRPIPPRPAHRALQSFVIRCLQPYRRTAFKPLLRPRPRQQWPEDSEHAAGRRLQGARLALSRSQRSRLEWITPNDVVGHPVRKTWSASPTS